MYNAIVLAGGLTNGELGKTCSLPYEALIEINGRPLVSYVVSALLNCSWLGKIAVVGPAEELKLILPENIVCLEGGNSLIENLLIGLKRLSGEKILVSSCDLPFLTPAAVEDFLNRCSHLEADFYYPIVAKEDICSRFPGVKRTYVHLKEGVFTGGNLFLLASGIIEKIEAYGESIAVLRKRPLQLARLLGFGFACKFLFRQLSLQEAEKKVEEIFNLNGTAIISPYPEISMDVDKKIDLELARLLSATS